MKWMSGSLSLLLLVFLSACGGGGKGESNTNTPPPNKVYADTLSFTPATSGDFRLVRSGRSSASHLILDLTYFGTATSASGAGFTLSVDNSKASWAAVEGVNGELVQMPQGGFDLSPGTPILKSRVTGNTLQVVAFQKGAKAAIPLSNGMVIASIALDLKLNLVPVNADVSLASVKGKALLMNAPESSTPTRSIDIQPGVVIAK